ncbi:MAG: 23S rRNA (guanosine2251-2'-O)-methyltransferase [Arenicella sp.]|jgi:23S rRNA (guanosine2251-2'-O)-methyltransferase
MATKSVWITGYHAIQAVLDRSPERVLAAYVVVNSSNATQTKFLSQLQSLGIALQSVDKRSLAKQCGSEQHQGIAVQARAKVEGTEQDLKDLVQSLLDSKQKQPLLLILDQVQDPHNFGACLRTADAAGVDAVIVAKDNACPMTPVVQKVASGAAETLAIFRVSNLARTMDSLKQQGVWLLGTSDKASHSLFQQNLDGALAIVMGAEGSGLRQLTEKKCDSLLSLPMAGSAVSSLNVSVATGVCLFEVVRQRNA